MVKFKTFASNGKFGKNWTKLASLLYFKAILVH